MAVTVVVLSGTDGGDPQTPGPAGRRALPPLSLTLDAPRLVLGRGEGCDVRLPDPSVSHRHASIRQRGGEHVLLDENSTNGTFMDQVRLPPQTPRVLRSGERVRLGRVWLEVRFEPAVIKGSTAAAAKELAVALVARGLAAQGEEPDPVVGVLEGSELGAGTTLVLSEVGRTYVLGRAEGADLRLEDPATGRRHATIVRKGDALLVTDGGAPAGTLIDGARIQEASWKPGQILTVGKTHLGLAYPAAEALAELERCPDERLPDGEVPPPAATASSEEEAPAPATNEAAGEATPTPAPAEAGSRARPKSDTGGWGTADSVVVMLALGVLALSAVGAVLLLGR